MELKKHTPYMMTKQGEVIECLPIHPYIKRDANVSSLEGLDELFGGQDRPGLRWVYKHAPTDRMRSLVLLVIKGMLETPPGLKTPQTLKETIKQE